LAGWQAYNRIEPFGDGLLDAHLAELKWLTATAHGAKVDLDQFKLWKTKQPEPQTPEELEAKFWHIVGAQERAQTQGAK
jgi:hypothetical protein